MMDIGPVCLFAALSETPPLAVCLVLWTSWILCPVSRPLLLRTLGFVLVTQPAGSWRCLSLCHSGPKSRVRSVSTHNSSWLGGPPLRGLPSAPTLPASPAACFPPPPPRIPLPWGVVLGSNILPASWQGWHLESLTRPPWHGCPGCGGWSRQQARQVPAHLDACPQSPCSSSPPPRPRVLPRRAPDSWALTPTQSL